MAKYKETLDYLYTQLPMFTRMGEAAYKPDLNNTLRLLDALGNPHHKLKCIHIAGTNGKGSTSNMLAAILQCAGYKTGLYTSPHLLDFRERIRIDGKMITKKFVVDFVERNKELFLEIQPSFFEMTVALCFVYFAIKKIDIAVIETGLGGRLDSTNVINPLLSIITNIGLDHTNLLGDTLEAIAFEKAGIIKLNTPVVIGETHNRTKKVFMQKALEMHSDILFADKKIRIKKVSNSNTYLTIQVNYQKKIWFHRLKVSLAGEYQLKNIATTLQSIQYLRRHFIVTDGQIRKALGNVQGITGFAGRWQVIKKHPTIILDTGHNAHGLKLSLKQLKETNSGKVHFVFGVVKDKKLDDILPLLPHDGAYHLCSPHLPRALPANELFEIFKKNNFQCKVYRNVTEAYLNACKSCKRNDLIFVGGSTFVVAEVLDHIKKSKRIQNKKTN